MNILVCIKQIIDPDAKLRIAESEQALVVDERTEYRVSEYDLYALEMALLLREALGEAKIDTVSVGPPRIGQALRRAMGMGADRGCRILSHEGADPDPFAIGRAIAGFARPRKYDLILAGVQSEDTMQGVVGPMIAAGLELPCATGVITVSPMKGGEIEASRELEGGRRERLAIQLPAVLTIQSGPTKPRYPSLSRMLQANRADLASFAIEDFGPAVERQTTICMTYPQPLRACRMLEGSPAEKAGKLRQILLERDVL